MKVTSNVGAESVNQSGGNTGVREDVMVEYASVRKASHGMQAERQRKVRHVLPVSVLALQPLSTAILIACLFESPGKETLK